MFANDAEGIDFAAPDVLLMQREAAAATQAHARQPGEPDRRAKLAAAAALFSETPAASEPGTEVAAMLASSDRAAALCQFLSFVFHGGKIANSPQATVRRLYAVTWRISPHLLNGLSLGEIAALTGETKQAVSWRAARVPAGYQHRKGAAAQKVNPATAAKAARENRKQTHGNK